MLAFAHAAALPHAHRGDGTLLGWLAVYSAALVPLSILGGWALQRLRPSHSQMQHLLSLVAGLMLGIAVLHMVPHALELSAEFTADHLGTAMLGGMIAMFLLIRWFHFHQHEPAEVLTCTQEHDHDTHHQHARRREPQRFGWTGVLLGMGLHTLMDGFALGAAMRTHADAAWPAIGVAIAVALHKPLDAMSITGLMMQQGWSLPSQMAINLGYAAVCPLGAVLLLLGMTDPTGYWVAAALAVSAGVFVCIALSDLLPEMEFHSHDRGTLTAALMLGVGIAGLLAWLEPVHTH